MRGWVALAASVLFALALATPATANHSVTEVMSTDQIADTGPSEDFTFSLDTISTDGSRVLFVSRRQFLAEDDDTSSDLYLSDNGAMTLVSSGPSGNNPSPVLTCGVGIPCFAHTPDLAKILFETNGSLVPEDTDSDWDLYMWSEGVTTMIAPTDPFAHSVITEDGERVFFDTSASLISGDTDSGATDLYEFSNGTYKLITVASNGSDSYVGDFLAASQPDGNRVFFKTDGALVPSDNDNNLDIYERSNGTTARITTASAGGEPFHGISKDGAHVLFTTFVQMTPNDTDAKVDLYDASGGNTVLVSTGPNDANQCASNNSSAANVSDDGNRVYFTSAEPLVAADTDGCVIDLYRRAGGVTTLITSESPETAPGGTFLTEFNGGTSMLFTTRQRLAAADTDSQSDLYELTGSTVTLRTPGTTQELGFQGMSSTGDRIFFSTGEALVPTDLDGGAGDLYEVSAGTYTNVTADLSESGLQSGLEKVSANGEYVAVRTGQSFGSDSDGGDLDVYRFRVASGTYARPKGATPFQVYLVPAYQQCAAPNRTHGPPLAFGSCAVPAQSSPRVTIGTADANGQPNKSIGTVRLDTIAGDPATPADEADVQIAVTDTDIRNTTGLGDYTGELQAMLGLRITDRDGALPSGGGPAAVTNADTSLNATVPCTATGDTAVGSSCSVTTSADALVPGVVVERRRTLWALDQVRVLDGGPDGDADTAGNAVFQVQGLFVP